MHPHKQSPTNLFPYIRSPKYPIMKKIFFALLSFSFFTASAQTVAEVIQKYATNAGGLDAVNKIKTAKFTGAISAQGNDFPITLQVVNGKASRADINIMGNEIINVYNNGKGWKQNPLAGATTPTEATAAELIELKPQSMLASALMDYKARGHQVELQGQEDVEGIKTFKIKMTGKDDNKVTTYYINASDYSLLKSATEGDMQGQKATIETWYSDVKVINGLKFFMTRTQKIDGQEFRTTKFENIELDVTIDEKIFDMPK
jgi:hypothetical protein